MAIIPPRLDDRAFDDLRAELIRRIPIHAPEWTDHNASDPGIALLRPEAQPCIRAASELYCGIVDEVEALGYDVFSRRATVGLNRRLRVAGVAWIDAVRARRALARSAA